MNEIPVKIKNSYFMLMFGDDNFHSVLSQYMYSPSDVVDYNIIFITNETFELFLSSGIKFHRLNLSSKVFLKYSEEYYAEYIDNDHMKGVLDDVYIPSNCSIDLNSDISIFKIFDEIIVGSLPVKISTKDDDLALMIKLSL